MRVLLVGEYSVLHNSLKEGLQMLGHEVKLIGNSDGFKQYPVDYDYEAKWLKKKAFTTLRKIFYRLFKFDLADLEYGIRFYFLLPKLKKFDVVQFINEASIKTTTKIEIYLIRKILKENKKSFVLTSGVDYLTLKFYIENKDYKSLLQPYFKDSKLKEFNSFFSYFSKGHIKIHRFIQSNFNGLIATDFDYIDAARKSPIFSAYIPYPINVSKLKFEKLKIEDKIIIFLGINKYSYHQKGIVYFENALKIIEQKFKNKVEIIITNTIPYSEYIELYNSAHILLDQAYCNDQGYNALEAMAKGKVVFTGAEQEFINYYNITDKVCINALPNVDYLVNELSYLIENPNEIVAIGHRARAFVEKEHDYIKIAKKYLNIWEEK
ncbi:MAG: glycosyltransferase [Flavobacterium sp.]|uniref:glycosyltransferase family protein n=1 Tax=Flavobacterium sp. TaxID=239 RepID=UPI00326561AE